MPANAERATGLRPGLRGLGALLAVAGLLVPVPARGQHFPPAEELELLLRYRVEDGAATAVALGLLEADGSTSVLTYGGSGTASAPGPGTVFEIGDLTMTFTATLLALMVERGEVALDDPVAEYLPEGARVPSRGRRHITLGDLALHRSGLPAEPPGRPEELTVEALYAFLSETKLEHPPGQGYEYSAVGYGLLGHALERAAGIPLPDLLRERVLRPLGMERTGYPLVDDLEEWAIPGHHDGEAVPPSVPGEGLRGATGLRSSPADMVAYLKANARPPDTELGRAMRTAQRVRGATDPDGEGRGFSWRQYVEAREPLLVTHGGRTAGFTALITFDRARGIGTVVLADGRDVRPWFGRNLLWLDPWPAETPMSADAGAGERYTGTYSTTVGRYKAVAGRGRHFIRSEEDGQLTYQRPGGVRMPLRARTDSSFYMVGAPYTLAFADGEEGMQMVASIDERESLRQQGQRWRAWRIGEAPSPEAGAGIAIPTTALLGLLAGLALVVVALSFRTRRRRA